MVLVHYIPGLFFAKLVLSRGVDDSPTRQAGELATSRLGESGSRWLSDSLNFRSRRVAYSPTRQVGESFFHYEYLREFEAKIETAGKEV